MIHSTSLIDPSTRFRVCLLKQEDQDYIIKTLLYPWQAVALIKRSAAGITETERQVFLTSSRMASRIECSVDQADLKDDKTFLYLCRDQNNHPQAMVLFVQGKKSIEVDTLITNPRNIRSVVNDSEREKVRGAATFLLNKVEAYARERKLRVELTYTDNARGFYTRNGYREEPYRRVVKTEEKIQQFK